MVEHANLRSVILDQQDKTIRPCDLIVGIRARIYLRLHFPRSVKKKQIDDGLFSQRYGEAARLIVGHITGAYLAAWKRTSVSANWHSSECRNK